jgi:hypothetical protein
MAASQSRRVLSALLASSSFRRVVLLLAFKLEKQQARMKPTP